MWFYKFWFDTVLYLPSLFPVSFIKTDQLYKSVEIQWGKWLDNVVCMTCLGYKLSTKDIDQLYGILFPQFKCSCYVKTLRMVSGVVKHISRLEDTPWDILKEEPIHNDEYEL